VVVCILLAGAALRYKYSMRRFIRRPATVISVSTVYGAAVSHGNQLRRVDAG